MNSVALPRGCFVKAPSEHDLRSISGRASKRWCRIPELAHAGRLMPSTHGSNVIKFNVMSDEGNT